MQNYLPVNKIFLKKKEEKQRESEYAVSGAGEIFEYESPDRNKAKEANNVVAGFCTTGKHAQVM